MAQETGGRVELALCDADAGRAAYAATLTAGGASYAAAVTIDEGVIVEGTWSPGEPPAWLRSLLAAFLRSAWKERQRGSEWPVRIHRWRAER